MKKVSGEGFTHFARYLRLNYSRNPFPTLYAQEAIDKQDPSRYSILHKLKNQPHDRLVWHFSSNTSRSKLPLAVMRNRLKRRWSEAFKEALLRHGYEHDGKRPARGPGEVRSVGLQGTLQVLIMEAGGWEENVDWFAKYANRLVDALESDKIEGKGKTTSSGSR